MIQLFCLPLKNLTMPDISAKTIEARNLFRKREKTPRPQKTTADKIKCLKRNIRGLNIDSDEGN
jgi:hypothetical protein